MNRAFLRSLVTFILLAAAALAAAPVMAQDLAPLLDRLDRLERDIRTLNVQLSRDGATAPAAATGASVPGQPVSKFAAARLGQRIDALEQDLRVATGGQETLNHQLRQLTGRLDKLVGDVDYRLGVIENRLGIAGPSAPTLTSQAPAPAGQPATGAAGAGISATTIAPAPVPVPAPPTVQPAGAQAIGPASPSGSLGTVSAKAVEAEEKARTSAGAPPAASPQAAAAPVPAQPAAPATTLPAGSPKDQYTYAFNLLRQTNYDQAEIALKQFIQAHGDNPLAGNARYWLGETFYVRADYQQAAQVFFEGFQSDPKGAKAPDMLLKLGMSLAQLNKKTEACATFDKVAADFAKSSSRIKTALERERQRTGCP